MHRMGIQASSEMGFRAANRITALPEANGDTDLPIANEFMLDGKRVAVKCAKPNNHQCGLTNGMRDRADCINRASLTVGVPSIRTGQSPNSWNNTQVSCRSTTGTADAWPSCPAPFIGAWEKVWAKWGLKTDWARCPVPIPGAKWARIYTLHLALR